MGGSLPAGVKNVSKNATPVVVRTCLIGPLLTQVHDDLGGSLVERVEVVAVFVVQTSVRELVDAPEAVHQFPEEEEKKTYV